MVKLLSVSMEELDQRDMLGFTNRVPGILKEIYPKEVPSVVNRFIASAEGYILIQQSLSGKASKAEISDSDHLADDEWRSLDFQIKAGVCQTHNMDQNVAAQAVKKVFSKYKDPTELKYEKEYAVLEELLGELEKIPVDVLKKAKVDENVQGLRKCVDDFRTIYTNKIKPEAAEETGLAQKAREQVHIWWNSVCAQIVADSYDNQGNAKFEAAVEKLNAAIRTIKPDA